MIDNSKIEDPFDCFAQLKMYRKRIYKGIFDTCLLTDGVFLFLYRDRIMRNEFDINTLYGLGKIFR